MRDSVPENPSKPSQAPSRRKIIARGQDAQLTQPQVERILRYYRSSIGLFCIPSRPVERPAGCQWLAGQRFFHRLLHSHGVAVSSLSSRLFRHRNAFCWGLFEEEVKTDFGFENLRVRICHSFIEWQTANAHKAEQALHFSSSPSHTSTRNVWLGQRHGIVTSLVWCIDCG